MNTVIGKREGRPGIWLIDADAAVALVQNVCGKEVHNLIESGWAFIGATWDREDVIALLRKLGLRIGLVFKPQCTMKHQLVVLSDEKKWMFDVGELDESIMVEGNGLAGPRKSA